MACCCTSSSCCTSAKPWSAILYVRCTDQTFAPCKLATNEACGCDKLSGIGSNSVASTYATWVTDGRQGKACQIKQSCGEFVTESACKSYCASYVSSFAGYQLSCDGLTGNIPWGNSQAYDPGGVDGTGYKSLYDCVLCEPNPLP